MKIYLVTVNQAMNWMMILIHHFKNCKEKNLIHGVYMMNFGIMIKEKYVKQTIIIYIIRHYVFR